MQQLRCGVCGRKLIVDRSNNRLILRCPKHGIVLRYYAKFNTTAVTRQQK
jgi:hypothetical protein